MIRNHPDHSGFKSSHVSLSRSRGLAPPSEKLCRNRISEEAICTCTGPQRESPYRVTNYSKTPGAGKAKLKRCAVPANDLHTARAFEQSEFPKDVGGSSTDAERSSAPMSVVRRERERRCRHERSEKFQD